MNVAMVVEMRMAMVGNMKMMMIGLATMNKNSHLINQRDEPDLYRDLYWTTRPGGQSIAAADRLWLSALALA